jgi:hypothetical protein
MRAAVQEERHDPRAATSHQDGDSRAFPEIRPIAR